MPNPYHIENTVRGRWLPQGRLTKIYQKLRFFNFWEKFLENKRNSMIAKYRAHYRFLLRRQNILTSVIRT